MGDELRAGSLHGLPVPLSRPSPPAPEPEPCYAAVEASMSGDPSPARVERSSTVGGGVALTLGVVDETLCGRHRATVAAHYAFLMAGHPRLGAVSPAGCLTADLLEHIVRLKQATDTDNAYLLLSGGMIRNDVGLWSSSTVRAVHIPTGSCHVEAELPNHVSGHAALCCPRVRTPNEHGRAGGAAPDQQLGSSSSPTECIVAGGFEDVARSSARCYTLCFRRGLGATEATNETWNEGSAMLERRHGGFAAAVVSCEHSSAPPAACCSDVAAVEVVCGDLPTTGSSVIAVAGGLDGPLRSGGRVLASAEWLCGDRNCWYPLSSMNSERYGCASASLPNQLVVVGGSAGRSNLASVEALDLRTNRWRELAPLPKALYGCAATSLRVSTTQRVIVACGGCDESRSAMADTYIYDVTADAWRTAAPQKPGALGTEAATGLLRTPRMCHAVAAVPRRCLPPELRTKFSDSTSAYGPVAAAQSDMEKATVEECMLALGGKPPNDAARIHGTVEVFDPLRCEWASMPWQLPEPMWHHCACLIFV